jgi:hypothetical protein
MTDPEEYAELVLEAHDALRALLAVTEPGTGLTLHAALNELGAMLTSEQDLDEILRDRTDRASKILQGAVPHDDREPAVEQSRRDYRERKDHWRQTPRAERWHWMLNALGDDVLTVAEILDRVQAAHPECELDQGNVRMEMYRMETRGEIERQPIPQANGPKAKWRYRRRQPNPDTLAQLEQAMHDGQETPGA